MGRDEAKIAQLKKIEVEIVEAFGGLMTQLRERSDANGALIDQTSILFGSNLGNANSHTSEDLPILVAGGRFLPREAHRPRGGEERSALQPVPDHAAEHGGGDRFVRAEHGNAYLVLKEPR